MCRFLVYKGRDSILLSNLILSPSHSILTQSYDSRLRLDTRRPHNGDGFGIGYYTPPSLGPEPCIFTSTIPAWNCQNLERLASKTESKLVFAHVRATTEGNLSEQNCHPFTYGRLMFMHNGGIGGWKYIKRKLGQSLRDEYYMFVQGGTDSEWAFALFLDTLEGMGFHPLRDGDAEKGFGHVVLRKAMLKTIARINAFARDIPPGSRTDEDGKSLLNFAVTDGQSVVCTRYVSSRTDEAASLFFSSGTDWVRSNPANSDVRNPSPSTTTPQQYIASSAAASGQADFKMERRDKGADIILVASEPLTFERDNWVTVPTNSILTLHKQTVLIHPILDEFWNQDPLAERSTSFAEAKGQTTEPAVGAAAAAVAGGGVADGRESCC